MLVKSVSGEELAGEQISILSVIYSIARDLLLATMRNQISINTAVLRTVKMVYPKVIDIGGFSHTLDRVGEQFCTPNLTEFTSAGLAYLHTVQRLD